MPLPTWAAEAPFFRNVLKCAVAFVQKKLVGLAFVELRTAVVGDAPDRAQRLVRVCPLHVIDDEEIEQAVVVHVDPDGRDRPVQTEFRVGTIQARIQP